MTPSSSCTASRSPAGLEPDEVRDRLLAGFHTSWWTNTRISTRPSMNDQCHCGPHTRTILTRSSRSSLWAMMTRISTRSAAPNVQFIQRFQQDYEAEVHYLVENYRSTRYIIEAANRLIAANVDRMKTRHPIRIDRHRELLGPGGEFGRRDGLKPGQKCSSFRSRTVPARRKRCWPKSAVSVNSGSLIGPAWPCSLASTVTSPRSGRWRKKSLSPSGGSLHEALCRPLHQIREIDCFPH